MRRILGQNRLRTERLPVAEGGLRLELNLADQIGDADPDLLLGETLPAGQGIERQGLGRGVAETVEVLAPLPAYSWVRSNQYPSRGSPLRR